VSKVEMWHLDGGGPIRVTPDSVENLESKGWTTTPPIETPEEPEEEE